MSLTEALNRVAELRSLAATAPFTASAATSATAATGAATIASTSTAASDGARFSRELSRASATPSRPAATAAAGGLGPDVPADLAPLITRAATENGLDPALVSAVVRAESGYRVDAGSPAGARGLMQLMPSTAASLGVTDILDPAQNLRAGARYLRQQLDRFGDTRLALAAYNAGPGAVSRHGGVPPYEETRTYIDRVMDHYDAARGVTAGA